MKKFLLIGAAIMALPAAASAQSVDGTVAVNGSVAAKCKFTTPSQTITIPELAGSDGKLDASTVNGQSKTLVGWCNGTSATMQVAAAPLDNAGSGGADFDSRINYTASAVANSVTATDSTTTLAAGTAQTVGLFSGNVVVTLSSAASAGGKLLLSGAYSGGVTVTLSPTVALP
jgi:hypothetical protein